MAQRGFDLSEVNVYEFLFSIQIAEKRLYLFTHNQLLFFPKVHCGGGYSSEFDEQDVDTCRSVNFYNPYVFSVRYPWKLFSFFVLNFRTTPYIILHAVMLSKENNDRNNKPPMEIYPFFVV